MSAPQLRKVRLPRVSHLEAHSVHDDGHSWAVSYADFLMVLLSFFIIFFSIDSDKRSHLINELQEGGGEKSANAAGAGNGSGAAGAGATTTANSKPRATAAKNSQGSAGDSTAAGRVNGIGPGMGLGAGSATFASAGLGAGAGSAAGTGSGSGSGNGDLKLPSPVMIPSELSAEILKLDGFIVEDGEKTRRLTVHFDDNIYRPGRVEMPPEQMPRLLEILGKLRAFQSQINITFEGHTDPSAVTKTKSRYLNDNFALSSLRATNALQTAVAIGLDPSYMYAKGGAENSRASRSLSIIITPREVEQ